MLISLYLGCLEITSSFLWCGFLRGLVISLYRVLRLMILTKTRELKTLNVKQDLGDKEVYANPTAKDRLISLSHNRNVKIFL